MMFIPKPKDNVRLSVDHRKFNEVTILDIYPLPSMDDLLNAAKTAQFMKMLHLNVSYHQASIYEPDCNITVYVCPLGILKNRLLNVILWLLNCVMTFIIVPVGSNKEK